MEVKTVLQIISIPIMLVCWGIGYSLMYVGEKLYSFSKKSFKEAMQEIKEDLL